MLNNELFDKDPTTYSIPNDGVAKVAQLPESAETEEQKKLWAVAKYECESFVCEGSYYDGLRRILDAYLANLSEPTQKAVWVHGFYGCGKSHLVRMLELLWSDVQFPDGSTARGLVSVPQDIRDALVELTAAGRQRGGLWSAAGTISSGGSDARAAILGVALRGAGLPERINQAQFDIWVRNERWYEAIRDGLAADGRNYQRELMNLYVSPLLARQLMRACPEFASSESDALTKIQGQFPDVREVTTPLLLAMLRQVLELKSERPGKTPCTLLVLDELQQHLGESHERTTQVQEAVEACVSEFGSALLFVATGQSALQATPILSKLKDRFTITIDLKDKDVERVLQQTVLRKSPAGKSQLDSVLDQCRGEIDRHFGGSLISPNTGDASVLAADYPLLPTRRRFWERVMRSVGAGTAGQLRTQLRLAHEAARAVADKPVGSVVGADFIFHQQRDSFLQNATLLREIDDTIQRLNDGTPDGELKSRICATVFLIDKLTEEVGLRATADSIADALVTDLPAGSADVRRRVQELLKVLTGEKRNATDGEDPHSRIPPVGAALVCMDGVYQLQTPVGAEWEGEYRRHLAEYKGDSPGIARDRDDQTKSIIVSSLGNLKLNQGDSKTPRDIEICYGGELPQAVAKVPVWIRTGWEVTEAAVKKDAADAGTESAVVFVFVPRQDDEEIRGNLAGAKAAQTVLDKRGIPTTDSGKVARAGVESRKSYHNSTLGELLSGIVDSAKVFQGGGTEVTQQIDFRTAVEFAAQASLARLFPRFKDADSAQWAKVIDRAKKGTADALTAIAYSGEVAQHPVCHAVLSHIGGSTMIGTDIRRQFAGTPYGWPQDAVDAALLTMLANNLVRATYRNEAVAVTQLDQTKLQQAQFRAEPIVIPIQRRLEIRKLISNAGITCETADIAVKASGYLAKMEELAKNAGGDAPLPIRPSTDLITDLQALTGNELLAKLDEERERLDRDRAAWQAAGELAAKRLPRWSRLQELLEHAKGLGAHADATAQSSSIKAGRTLLSEPDPVQPVVTSICTALREAVQAAREKHLDEYREKIDDLLESETWKKLAEAKQEETRQAHDLVPLPELKIGTEEELLAELKQRSLKSWEDRTAAMAARVASALLDAERELQPKAQSYAMPKRTVTTETELDAYLSEVRAKVLEIMDGENPVVLS